MIVVAAPSPSVVDRLLWLALILGAGGVIASCW